jgi:hypothetical protein
MSELKSAGGKCCRLHARRGEKERFTHLSEKGLHHECGQGKDGGAVERGSESANKLAIADWLRRNHVVGT